MFVHRSRRRELLTRSLSFALINLLILGPANRVFSQPITIPVVVGGKVIGNIEVFDAVTGGRTGIRGGFYSSTGDPPTLEAAYAAAGEDHFNWYQIVVVDPFPPVDPSGHRLSPPYVDVPPGGYGDDPSTLGDDKVWGDQIPWYWDEGDDPPAGTAGFQDGYNVDDQYDDTIGNDGFVDTFIFEDVPFSTGNLRFKTWLVSLNEDGSFDSWHEGFSWDWSPGDVGVTNITSLSSPPSDAEYKDIIGGFQESVPEPSTFVLLAIGLGSFAVIRRRNARMTT
jgi:hypothetical protein